MDQLLDQGAISDPRVAKVLGAGSACQAASAEFVGQFSPELQAEIRIIYRLGIQRVFQVALVFAEVAFLLSLMEKEVKLRKTLETDFGLEEKKDKKKTSNGGQNADV